MLLHHKCLRLYPLAPSSHSPRPLSRSHYHSHPMPTHVRCYGLGRSQSRHQSHSTSRTMAIWCHAPIPSCHCKRCSAPLRWSHESLKHYIYALLLALLFPTAVSHPFSPDGQTHTEVWSHPVPHIWRAMAFQLVEWVNFLAKIVNSPIITNLWAYSYLKTSFLLGTPSVLWT